jgi:hypothetical protein
MTDSDFEIKGATLKTKAFEVKFPFKIDEVLYHKGVFIVLLDTWRLPTEFNNIYGVSAQGEIVWRIEDSDIVYASFKTGTQIDFYFEPVYVGMNHKEGDVFTTTTFGGISFDFDYQTGKLLERRQPLKPW